MNAPPVFRLSPRVLSDVVWRDLLADADLDLDLVRAKLAALWEACESTRARMAYNTGSISPSTGVVLHALARRLAPKAIFEVGTFVGKSTVALALGTESAGSTQAAIYTCDGSNDFLLPYSGTTRIVGFPRKTSTQALAEVVAQGVQIDLFNLDGRISEADCATMQRLAKAQTVIAIDDFEGQEKGVANMSLLRSQAWIRPYALVYPPERALLAEFGLHSACTTALLLPLTLFGFTKQ